MENTTSTDMTSPSPPTPDREGHRRARASDPADWVDRHGDAMYRFALLRVRDPDVAEEMVQDALVAALAARAKRNATSSERTWLIGILKHKLIDHFRANASKRRVTESIEPDRAVEAMFSKRGLWSPGPGRWASHPRCTLENEEFWKVFRECNANLPPAMADAFCLREIEQMSSREVCQVLGISSSNLWALLHRARVRLRNCLEVNWFKSKVGRGR
jgi:RNA polymerase sigma-70 factor (TIGR02943 family)